MTLVLDFAPRRQLVEWLSNGWSPVAGHEYDHRDYAFVLQQDGRKRPRNKAETLANSLTRPRRRPKLGNAHYGNAAACETKLRKYGTLDGKAIRAMCGARA